MKKKSFIFLLFLILGAFFVTSCQPKIYGQVKRKKDRKCGCMVVQPAPSDLCSNTEK